MSGCQNENIVETISETSVFYATIDDNNTKTSLDEDGNVLWKQGDLVSVFPENTSNREYKVTDDSDGKTSATLNEVPAVTAPAGFDISNNVAFYPYSTGNKLEDKNGYYEIRYILPATQTYVAGSFGNGSFPMVAVTTSTSDNNFGFKNVLGGLKLQLKGTALIKSISISGNNNEILCGKSIVTASNGNTPTITLSDASAKTVTLDCGAGVQLNTNTAIPFIIALPPITMSGGFTVVISDTNGKMMEFKTTRSQTITRSCLLKMPEVNNISVSTTPEYSCIDLGLSVKWATFNVGATKPEELGDYYAWGATEPWYQSGYALVNPISRWKPGKSAGYCLTNAPYLTSCTNDLSSSKWSKYIGNITSDYKDESATDEDASKKILDLSDDAARANWGGSWRMPTIEEWSELMNSDNCTWEWTEINGMKGYKVKSRKTGFSDNYIFLPAANSIADKTIFPPGKVGKYQSSSLYTKNPNSAQSLYFNIDETTLIKISRGAGLSIRPVCSDYSSIGVTGISLNKSETIINVGNRETLIAIVTKSNDVANTQVEWSSSNTAVATVDNSGRVTGVSGGSATITAMSVSAGIAASCTVKVLEYVDLGLSVKWATFNVGATSPEEYGDYFAWAETTPKSDYTWKTYKYCNGSGSSLTKYCKYNTYGYNGYRDFLSSLDISDDAANVNWGDKWKIPSYHDWCELMNSDNCTWEWTSINGINGYKIQSKIAEYKDNWIFIPAAGCRNYTDLKYESESCKYWSETNNTHLPYESGAVLFTSTIYTIMMGERCQGLTIRPVYPKSE